MPGALFGLPGSPLPPPPLHCKFLYEVSRINISGADIWIGGINKKAGGKFAPAGAALRWADNGHAIAPQCVVQNLRDAAAPPHDAMERRSFSERVSGDVTSSKTSGAAGSGIK